MPQRRTQIDLSSTCPQLRANSSFARFHPVPRDHSSVIHRTLVSLADVHRLGHLPSGT